ncbi:MAG: glycosyltransferase family 2 protein [Thermoproteota archaeon]
MAGIKMGDKRVVVGIPACDEEDSIAQVVLKARQYGDKVVVCDDGSQDYTADIAEGLGAEVIRHGENRGYGAALQSLFARARQLDADVLVTLDADGQHNPEEIPILVRTIREGEADLVIGSRFSSDSQVQDGGMPWYRKLGIKLITKLSNTASKLGLRDAQSGFRAYSRNALETLNVSEDRMGASLEILLQAQKQGLKVKEVPASCDYEGMKSSQNPVGHGANVLMYLIKIVVEEKPLTFLGVPGVFSLGLGTCFGVWMLRAYAVEHRIITNIALASIAFIIIGFFFLSTAITLYAIQRIVKITTS